MGVVLELGTNQVECTFKTSLAWAAENVMQGMKRWTKGFKDTFISASTALCGRAGGAVAAAAVASLEGRLNRQINAGTVVVTGCRRGWGQGALGLVWLRQSFPFTSLSSPYFFSWIFLLFLMGFPSFS